MDAKENVPNMYYRDDKLMPIEKFEYCIKDVTELGRRHTQFNFYTLDGYSSTTYETPQGILTDYSSGASWLKTWFWSFCVYPLHPICKMFAGWSGHLKYRFIIRLQPTLS